MDIIPKLAEIASSLKNGGLQHVVVVGQLEMDRRPKVPLHTIGGVNVLAYPDLLDPKACEIDFWCGPSNAPLWVLYSSGTSQFCQHDRVFCPLTVSSLAAGKPKAIVHGQLAMIFAWKQGALLHEGLRPGNCHMQITTTGWMMWCVSALTRWL